MPRRNKMNKEILIEKLNEYADIKEKDILFYEAKINNIKFLKIREIIYSFGSLLEQDDENKILVGVIKSGSLKANQSYIAIQLMDKKLYFAIYSSEGLIKQNSSEKTLDLFLKELNIKNNDKNQTRNFKKYISFLLIIILVIVNILFMPKFLSLNDAISYTKQYNIAVDKYNQSVKSYNSIAKESNLENIDGYLAKYEKLSKQSTKSKDVMHSLFNGNSVSTIKEDITTLKEMKKSLDKKTSIAKQLINPSEEWVMNKLSKCSDASNIQAVTEDNDPNQLLNKEEGYTSTIYFTISQLVEDENADPIELGTDGGGSIEVYKNIDDAKARCNYLASFDNSILPTGSYALIGTMVVRTSYQLDSTSQYNLTDEIFSSLTDDSK